MKQKILSVLLILTLVFALSACSGGQQPSKEVETSVETTSPTTSTIDELWNMLEGTWSLEKYTYKGKVTQELDHLREFSYTDEMPCMHTEYLKEGLLAKDRLFYEAIAVDEYHYDAYIYKRDEYGGEDGNNWGDDVRRVWWSFDLSNLSSGEIVMTYNIEQDNDPLNNGNVYYYSRQ